MACWHTCLLSPDFDLSTDFDFLSLDFLSRDFDFLSLDLDRRALESGWCWSLECERCWSREWRFLSWSLSRIISEEFLDKGLVGLLSCEFGVGLLYASVFLLFPWLCFWSRAALICFYSTQMQDNMNKITIPSV